MGSCMSSGEAAKVQTRAVSSGVFSAKDVGYDPGALGSISHVETDEELKATREQERMEKKIEAAYRRKLTPSERRQSEKPFDLFKQVSVTELLNFHNQIEEEYNENPFVFQQYLKILSEYKSRRELLERVRGLFKGHDGLVEMFEEILFNKSGKKDTLESVLSSATKAGDAVEYLDSLREQLPKRDFDSFVENLAKFKYGEIDESLCLENAKRILADKPLLLARLHGIIALSKGKRDN